LSLRSDGGVHPRRVSGHGGFGKASLARGDRDDPALDKTGRYGHNPDRASHVDVEINGADLMRWRIVTVLLFLSLFGLQIAVAETSHIIEKRTSAFTPDKLLWIEPDALREKIRTRAEEGARAFHLVDLRLEVDYQRGSIAGAVNAPQAKLRFLAEKLWAKEDEIILYGYPVNDNVSINAVIFLVNKGFEEVYLLKGGYSEEISPQI